MLYNVYNIMKSHKRLGSPQRKKFKIEDVDTKNFFVDKFLEYRMVDSKMVISLVLELQVFLYDIHAENMTIGETFQIVAIIEKLPPTGKDFKNYFKNKCKEMNVEELIVLFRIEEKKQEI